jgi:hypothetical protein
MIDHMAVSIVFVIYFSMNQVSGKDLLELKKNFLETYDDNRDGRIEIREASTTMIYLRWNNNKPKYNYYFLKKKYRCLYCSGPGEAGITMLS